MSSVRPHPRPRYASRSQRCLISHTPASLGPASGPRRIRRPCRRRRTRRNIPDGGDELRGIGVCPPVHAGPAGNPSGAAREVLVEQLGGDRIVDRGRDVAGHAPRLRWSTMVSGGRRGRRDGQDGQPRAAADRRGATISSCTPRSARGRAHRRCAGADIVFDVTVPAVSPDIVETRRSTAASRCSSARRAGQPSASRRLRAPRRELAARRRARAELLARLGARDRVRGARRPVVRVHRDRREPPRGQGRLALRHRDPHRRAHRRAPARPARRGAARRPARPRAAGRERPDPQPPASRARRPAGGRLRRRRRGADDQPRHARTVLLRGGHPARAARGAMRAGVVVGLDKLLDLGLLERGAG